MNRVSAMAAQSANINIHERLNNAAEDGDIERLYKLILEDPYILEHYDQVPFCETPLHMAARKGRTLFAMELMTLKPSLSLKLNTSGLSSIHIALQSNHIRMVRGFITMDSSLVLIKGRGRSTPLHYVARIGDVEMLSEFLIACPSSVEDLTIKYERVMHIALKNHHIEAFKVLLGWVKRVNREKILDWKDEDCNTVLHIAASINQTEVMKLLRGTVKVNAKNLNGKTVADILQTHQSPLSPEASSLESVTMTTLVGYLRKKISFIEKRNNLFGVTNLIKSRHRYLSSNDSRSVILVVAILIVTATYQANLSSPGGFWQEDSKDHAAVGGHYAGEMTMPFLFAIIFYFFNGIAFFTSLYVIVILIIGLPMWKILYASTAALGLANSAAFVVTLPTPHSMIEFVARNLILTGYPLITGILICCPFLAFVRNKRCRSQVDFSTRYFSSPHELLG